jgi:hypothetical protein
MASEEATGNKTGCQNKQTHLGGDDNTKKLGRQASSLKLPD